MPVEGSPLITTLPVDNEHVGGVITPTVGADGIEGCAVITTLPDDGEIHPKELVTVKVYVPSDRLGIVVLVPEPVVVKAPGERTRVQLPVGGNPVRITLPVDIVQVG